MKAAFQKLNLHSFNRNQEYLNQKSTILCLSNFLCDCHQMDVCISVIIYEYSI